LLGESANNATFYHGRGCPHCNNTGYSGRVGVFEFLEIDDELTDDLRHEDSAAFAKHAKASPSFRPFSRHAMEYATKGITSLEEVIRVTGMVEEDLDKHEFQLENN
jgi:MSHA biogenesis protein MshE